MQKENRKKDKEEMAQLDACMMVVMDESVNQPAKQTLAYDFYNLIEMKLRLHTFHSESWNSAYVTQATTQWGKGITVHAPPQALPFAQSVVAQGGLERILRRISA